MKSIFYSSAQKSELLAFEIQIYEIIKLNRDGMRCINGVRLSLLLKLVSDKIVECRSDNNNTIALDRRAESFSE